jgi:hypothetical protein
VWVEDELLAVIEARQGRSSEEEKGRSSEEETEYNGPLLETVAAALSETLAARRRLAVLQEVAVMCPGASLSNEAFATRCAELGRAALGANLFSVWVNQGHEVAAVAHAEKPSTSSAPPAIVRRIASGIASTGQILRISDTAAPESLAVMNTMGFTEEECTNVAKVFRSAIALRTELRRGRQFVLLAFTTRRQCYKLSFDLEDWTALTLMGGLLAATAPGANGPMSS